MLLQVLCCSDRKLITISPILILSAAIPGVGILLQVAVAWTSLGTGFAGAAFLLFIGFSLFILGVAAYAFALAARSQTIRCWRDGPRMHVTKHGSSLEAEASAVVVAVQTRTVGMQGKVTLHEVTLSAPGFRESVTLHSGLTRWAAARAATRVREHIAL